jgi:hypothetical protein
LSLRKRQYATEADEKIGKRLLVKATSHRIADYIRGSILHDANRRSLKSFQRETGKGVFEVTPEELERIRSGPKSKLIPNFKDGPDLMKAWSFGTATEPIKEDADKEMLKTPWFTNPSHYLFLLGVHEPWIMEISPTQYARMSEREKIRYDKKRNEEWQASADAKKEYADLVYKAYKEGKFDINDPKVHPEARSAAIMRVISSEKAAREAAFQDASRKNRITDAKDVEVGMRVYSIMCTQYGKVIKKIKGSIHIDFGNGKVYRENARQLQWLSYDDLKKMVGGEK